MGLGQKFEKFSALKAQLKARAGLSIPLAELTADEHVFLGVRVAQRNTATASWCIDLATLYHGVSLFTDPLIVAAEDRTFFFWTHLTFLTCHLSWQLWLKKTRINAYYYLWILQLAFISALGYVVQRTIIRGNADDIMLSSSALLVISTIMLIACPFLNYMVAVTAGLYVAVAGVACVGQKIGIRWALVDAMVLTTVASYQFYAGAKLKVSALKEFRTLRALAPKQVVRAAVELGGSIEAHFHPAMRAVACVSSDWRDYQRFSRLQEPDVVAATLNDFYTMCERLLADVAPEGNYYSDWIADELFIVFFDRYGAPTKPLIRQALEFSRRLLKEKAAFIENHKMPQGIDLGIAAGSAYVGMMGHYGHRKATALGETPGLSRRLQTTGRLLRHRLGEKDRIIVDGNVEAWLRRYEPFKVFRKGEGERIRDLEGSEIFYLEPEAEEESQRKAG